MRRSDLALAALACAAVPGMRPVRVAEVFPRDEHEAASQQVAFVEDVTGRRWVVRVPLNAATGAELERNEALVAQLGRHLPFKVPAAAGFARAGEHGRAVVRPFVEGSALDLRRLPAGPGLASAVGRAVAAVHNMPAGLYEDAGVPVFTAASYRSRKLAELDRAAETGQVPTGLLARWEQALEAVPLWHFAPVPTHGRLDGRSLLVAFTDDDAASGRVVALTGWEHAQVADPADDFAALVQQAAPRALESVVESYSLARSQRPDPALVNRARLAAEMSLLAGLAAAWSAGDEEVVRRRGDALRKLDRLTAGDESLVPGPAAPAPTAPVHPVPTDPPAAGPPAAGPPPATPPADDSSPATPAPSGTPPAASPESPESPASPASPANDEHADPAPRGPEATPPGQASPGAAGQDDVAAPPDDVTQEIPTATSAPGSQPDAS